MLNIALLKVTDALDFAFKGVAAAYILMWLVPSLPEALAIDMITSGVSVAVFLAVLVVIRPFLQRLTLATRIELAHKAAMAQKARRKS